MNNQCYRFQKINFKKGLLDDCIDATYILHLENNGRMEAIMSQLEHYQPSKILYIVFNKGYKNCNKEEFINAPALDLIDGFLKIFKHANENQYENILILEDDFIFHKDIKNKNVQKDVCDFVNQRKQTSFQYALGCTPTLLYPYTLNSKHYFAIIGFAMHACINSKKHRIEILNIPQHKLYDWDFHSFLSMNKFCYYKPLCYQLFPETENNKTWGDNNIIIYYLVLFTIKQFIKVIKLDTRPEPGYSIIYTSSKILSFVLFIFLIYLILASLFYFIK